MPFSAQPTQQFQAIPAQPAYQPGPGPGYPAPLPFSYGSPPKQAGSVLSVVAFVLAALALVVPLIGVAGVICGVVARQRGERLGTIAASVAAGCTLLSFVLRLVLAMVS
jgi:hypothetical protein